MAETTPAQELHEVTPERMRVLAARAESLAAAIRAAQEDFRAHADEPVRRAGYRLDEAIGCARSAATELRETAADLDRIAGAAKPGTCAIPWGVCPRHGNTLVSSGGRAWCKLAHCVNEWDYDRVFLPCTEPARWRLKDAEGDGAVICDGHAIDARERLVGGTVEPLEVATGG